KQGGRQGQGNGDDRPGHQTRPRGTQQAKQAVAGHAAMVMKVGLHGGQFNTGGRSGSRRFSPFDPLGRLGSGSSLTLRPHGDPPPADAPAPGESPDGAYERSGPG